MHLFWLGTTAMKIQTKHDGSDVTIVFDPYKPAAGSFPRSLTPDIALFSRGDKDAVTLSGDPFVLDTAGEIETKGVLVTAAASTTDQHLAFRLDAEQISVGHLGLTKEQPTGKILNVLSGVDILLVPVGHPDAFDPEQAMKAINTIEPRVVIPMAFKSDNDPKAADVSGFMKEIGSSVSAESKAIFKKKDLPQEETLVVLLDKE